MKIGFLFEDNGIVNKNLMDSPKGNPGIGGTSYMYVILAHYINKMYSDIDITFFREGNNPLESFIKCVNVGNIYNFDSVDEVKTMDIFIVNAKNINSKLIKKINKIGVKTIVWAHNYISAEQANLIADCSNIVRVVFVGHQEYDKYIDHRIIKKSTYIYNMFNADLPEFYRNKEYKPYVTYVGSLTRAKGFHILAKYWKDVIKEVPKAELHIIGGGNLYLANAKLGKYNIADEEYENEFMPYLIDDSDSGKIMKSVVFHGVMGQEKSEIYHNTAVGIINPSAETETFGISAVEMSACGIPVVTRRMYGLIDTVRDKKTGLLFDKYSDFPKLIVKLLKNTTLNEQYGKNGIHFVKKFSPENITKQWYDLFTEILNGKKAKVIFPKDNYFVDNKWLRVINYSIKNVLPFLPSIIECTDKLKKILKR